ncbi:exodeoxyribonuclease V subunit alpha [Dokdonella sp.]|uniref:exodeoxyribonuclease V subunit alpha n=1 Tax=Dokdonella sp. TaxID=2291710 RepID=UPI001B23B7C1|nr:exodeoxyribonuclease V subunit alpha [Dokdonella sp.]MBO9661603.1 exodeoxyribonuclease V subunit alpha [Dokdonella sp.]
MLSRLHQAGALRAIDVEFARLIARLDGRDDAALALAAAAASQALAQGHSCLPLNALHDVLAAAATAPLRGALPDRAAVLAALRTSPMVGTGDAAPPLLLDEHERLWLRRYRDYERRVAAGLLRRARSVRPLATAERVRASLAGTFALDGDTDWQAVAVALGLRSRLAVIGGGPGTGKTSSVLWLLVALLEQAEAAGAPLPRIRLAAPTGKAAARLGEAIRARKATLACSETVRAAIREDEAATIHRLLKFRPRAGFRHDRAHPLAADIVVIDEASMIDLPLMAHLLDALPDEAGLILLGDIGQLASVEAGHVLASIAPPDEEANRYSAATADYLRAATGFVLPSARSPAHPLGDAFVELQRSHRYAEGGGIGRLARAIRAGDAEAVVERLREGDAEVAWKPLDRAQVSRVARERWTPRFGELAAAADARAALDAATRLRVLCALREGPFGCVAINRAIEANLGEGAAWYHGRLVMITANDYRHGLFNGDIGVAWRAPDGRFEVWFAGDDGALRAFAPSILPAHESAFAMTVHKSQGSEFDEVAIVLPDSPSAVLGRELLYTAVTRARRALAVHGEEAILRASIARRVERYSGLADFLREGVDGAAAGGGAGEAD